MNIRSALFPFGILITNIVYSQTVEEHTEEVLFKINEEIKNSTPTLVEREPYTAFNEDFFKLLERTNEIEIFESKGREKKGKKSWIRGKRLAAIKNPAIIESLKEEIGFDLEKSGGHCLCSVDFVFAFKNEKREIAELGLIMGHIFRWPRGPWEGEGELTSESILSLIELMLFLGIENPIQWNLPASFEDIEIKP